MDETCLNLINPHKSYLILADWNANVWIESQVYED